MCCSLKLGSAAASSGSYWCGQLGQLDILSGCCEAAAVWKAFGRGPALGGAARPVIPPEAMAGGEWYHRLLLRIDPVRYWSPQCEPPPLQLTTLLSLGGAAVRGRSGAVEAHRVGSFRDAIPPVGGMRRLMRMLCWRGHLAAAVQIIVGLVAGSKVNMHDLCNNGGWQLLLACLTARSEELDEAAVGQLTNLLLMDETGVIEDQQHLRSVPALQLFARLLSYGKLSPAVRCMLVRAAGPKLLASSQNRARWLEQAGMERAVSILEACAVQSRACWVSVVCLLCGEPRAQLLPVIQFVVARRAEPVGAALVTPCHLCTA